MQMVFAIAAGGAVGALLRFYVAGHVVKLLGDNGFPYGTFAVNVIGSLVMGVLITALAVKFEAAPELRGFLTVGILGSFTTFSTFSLETALLIQRGEWHLAMMYIVGSVVVGVLALFAGMWIGKAVL
ncbi:MAG: fluoride efflux transporter CrcB [Kordiimonadaceae bacterium]|nr:fluoride efflux transporter CrcB [Kordiimonadaceae bacterium]